MFKNVWVIGAVFLVIGLAAGYFYGDSVAFKKAYDKAVADIKTQQELAAKNAVEEAAKAANPFKMDNPLEGVDANPFAEAQKALNPFSGQ